MWDHRPPARVCRRRRVHGRNGRGHTSRSSGSAGSEGGVVAYVVVNLFLTGACAVTGFGYFWPSWVLAGWGMLDARNVCFRRPLTEDDIDRELRNRAIRAMSSRSSTVEDALGGNMKVLPAHQPRCP